MKSILKNSVKLLICCLALARAQYGPTEACPDDPFALRSDCGNKCELTCDNIEKEVDYLFVYDKTKGCENRCNCQPGYVRDKDGDCIKQTRRTCDVDPCAKVKHTLFHRCALFDGPTCFIMDCSRAKFRRYYKSRCVCKPGYGLNMERKCVRLSSQECQALRGKKGPCLK